jgi:hypothetical protein
MNDMQLQMNGTRLRRLWRLNVILDDTKAHGKELNMWVWETETDCGTACCALGWAGHDESFRQEGLKTINGKVYHIGAEGIFAAADFFHITMEEAHYIFLPSQYNIADRVKRRVQNATIPYRYEKYSDMVTIDDVKAHLNDIIFKYER